MPRPRWCRTRESKIEVYCKSNPHSLYPPRQVNYFSWLEEEILNGAQINEYDAATRLEEFRK